MRRNPRFFRLTTTLVLTALGLDPILPLAAVAQPAPPPLPPAPGQPGQNQADPPVRVGRVAGITGTVSFHNQGDTQWSPARVNYPVSSGNAFWTEPAAEARLEVSDSQLALAGGSEVDIYTLDATGLQAVAVQGEAYFRLRNLSPNEAWSVQTPRGLVRFGGEGRYEIAVGTTDQPTMVTVVDGSVLIEGPNISLQVAAGQTATITGADTFQGSIGPAVHDGFLASRLNAERLAPVPAGVPAQVAVMPGGSDLYGVGNWSDAPAYGRVWYPPVAPGWVPYREGHWAYVAPWGWTWIDDASWGFAPFHYGRWLQVDGRWAWTPGTQAVAGPPVYAPALVTFIGIGAGVALGSALAAGSIGWVPLGPREPYRPWYHASDRYMREVNVNHVTNISNTNVTINNYINRGAATSVPAAAMMGSRSIQGVGRPVSAQEFAQARPIVGQQPLRPGAATAGVTPIVARQLNLAPTAELRPAPGPTVRVQAPGAGGMAFSRPALMPDRGPVAGNTAIQPGPGVVPGPAAPNRPGAPGPVPGVAPNAAPPSRPGVPGVGVPGAGMPGVPGPGVAPNIAAPTRPGMPISGPQGPGMPGPGAQGPGMRGPGVQGPGMQGPGMQGPGMPGPGGARGPGTQGPGTQGPGMQPPGTRGQITPGPGMQIPGAPVPGTRPVPGAGSGGTTSLHPGMATPGMPTPGMPTPGMPAPGMQPVPGSVPNAFQPNRRPDGRPAGAPQPGYQGAPGAGGPPAGAITRPVPPQVMPPQMMPPHVMQHPAPAPAPAPMAMPRPAPQIAPAPHPEPRFVAPPPAAAPHVDMRPAAPPAMRPAAPPPMRPAALPPMHPAAPPAPVQAPALAPPAARPAAALPQPQVQQQVHPGPPGHERKPNER